EALEVDDDIKELIIKRASEVEIRKAALAKGMVPLKENAMAKVIRGITTLEELARVVGTV
ncbi:type II secretion system protein GspE, partial [Candidatus Aerophobetes bacterium]